MSKNTIYARVNGFGGVETSYSKNFTNGICTYSSKGGLLEWAKAVENHFDCKIEIIWK